MPRTHSSTKLSLSGSTSEATITLQAARSKSSGNSLRWMPSTALSRLYSTRTNSMPPISSSAFTKT